VKTEAQKIEGIIKNPVGIGGGREGPCDFVAILSPWRVKGGEIVKKDMRLVVPCPSYAPANRTWDRFRAGQAIALTVTGPRFKKGWPWWDATATSRIRLIDSRPFQRRTRPFTTCFAEPTPWEFFRSRAGRR
jgi:hypothetical protein